MKKPLVLPMDVRLMQWTATVMLALTFVMCVASGIGWLLRHPAFSIQSITVRGNVTHSNPVTLRANVMPQLTGNFFTLNLLFTKCENIFFNFFTESVNVYFKI
jgi:cell division protein FtsQ